VAFVTLSTFAAKPAATRTNKVHRLQPDAFAEPVSMLSVMALTVAEGEIRRVQSFFSLEFSIACSSSYRSAGPVEDILKACDDLKAQIQRSSSNKSKALDFFPHSPLRVCLAQPDRYHPCCSREQCGLYTSFRHDKSALRTTVSGWTPNGSPPVVCFERIDA
jgi:hypothetical protein